MSSNEIEPEYLEIRSSVTFKQDAGGRMVAEARVGAYLPECLAEAFEFADRFNVPVTLTHPSLEGYKAEINPDETFLDLLQRLGPNP